MDSGYSEKLDENGYRTLKEFTGPSLQELDTTNGDLGGSEDGSFCGARDSSSGSATPDGTTNRRSSCGSPGHDHYRGDYQAQDVQSLRTTDLLGWAFQISRGMEYLASRKVLHGDLAARNVLLDENMVVKICDFGLAKEMYKDYKYKKNTNGVPLPLKWMAIESIFFGIFSTQSDCWSFGIVLWELFTLGQTPYPAMEADANFFELISEGYRMKKPKLAPCSMYDIMVECWAHEPTERPTFSVLVERIGDMLEERQRKHYINLNAPYLYDDNQKNFTTGQTDYSSAMGRTENKQYHERDSTRDTYENVPSPKELDLSGCFMAHVSPASPITPNFLKKSSSSPKYKPACSGSFIYPSTLEAQNPMYGILNSSDTFEENLEEMELHDNKNELSQEINLTIST